MSKFAAEQTDAVILRLFSFREYVLQAGMYPRMVAISLNFAVATTNGLVAPVSCGGFPRYVCLRTVVLDAFPPLARGPLVLQNVFPLAWAPGR